MPCTPLVQLQKERNYLVIMARETPSLCLYLHSNHTCFAGMMLIESPLLSHFFQTCKRLSISSPAVDCKAWSESLYTPQSAFAFNRQHQDWWYYSQVWATETKMGCGHNFKPRSQQALVISLGVSAVCFQFSQQKIHSKKSLSSQASAFFKRMTTKTNKPSKTNQNKQTKTPPFPPQKNHPKTHTNKKQKHVSASLK